MPWLIFVGTSLVVVLAAIKLAQYGDVIAVRTRLGGMFIGALLLAGATSLPEMVTTISSLNQSVPNLAAGNLFGSNMFNMFLLAALDMMFVRSRILRRVAVTHALTASLASTMIVLSILFILAGVDLQIGWIGLDSLIVILAYLGGVRLIQRQGITSGADLQAGEPEPLMSLRRAVCGFIGAAGVLILVVPQLVRASVQIAELTGLGTGFVGTALVAFVTSLPETVAVVAAARFGAYDLAVGNLFGSNVFNMLVLGLADVFYTQGRFLGAVDPAFGLAGLIALLLTNMALVGNIARLERRFLFIEIDAFLIAICYGLGLLLLYQRGIGL
jgi:cation:H+ antiporter